MMTVDARRTDTDVLAGALAAGMARARQAHGPVLVSVTRPVAAGDPLAFFVRGGALAADRVYWAQSSVGLALAGIGAAHSFTASGPDRFTPINQAWQELLATALIVPDPAAPGVGPLLLGGFAFDPQRPASGLWAGFPPALLLLPRLLLRATPAGAWLTASVRLWPDSDPAAEAARLRHEIADCGLQIADYVEGTGNREQGSAINIELLTSNPQPPTPNPHASSAWQATVARAAAAIRGGALEKVVLAREEIVQAATPFDVGAALDRLHTQYPNCYTFAVARGDQCFLGASPERLVRAAGGQVQVTCLAGSTARGATPAADAQRGAALLASAKNRLEHAVVAHMLQAALAEVCIDVAMPATPQLLKLPNVQHLYTPVMARLAPGRRLLDVVARLHPTPAVGGAPREPALAWIRAHEGLDRGWYAGPVGWLDAAGDGEFAVALRSGLVAGATAHLFAGCGIMGDSDPAAEYAESALKLRPMLDALGVKRET